MKPNSFLKDEATARSEFMNTTRRCRDLKRLSIDLLIAALVVGFCISAAEAVDPVPDWKTLVMPTLVPKAGHGPGAPDGYAAGAIRNAYDTTYEDYWKDTSYFRYDHATGERIRGYYNDT